MIWEVFPSRTAYIKEQVTCSLKVRKSHIKPSGCDMSLLNFVLRFIFLLVTGLYVFYFLF